jgi:hypothetical protein
LAKGNIDLDPAFQRRDAWTPKRKSLFIESLILGLPVPQIVLAEKPSAKGAFVIIDGKQRLLSLQKFTSGGSEPFALTGLKIRHDLNGATYSDLKKNKDDLNSFENQTIRTVVIRNWQKEDLLYLIFHRLNSQTLPLSPQELRQALHPGPFLRFCDEHSQDSPALKRILNLSKPDFRMRDIELLVRYFAFRNFGDTYRGNLKKFLDEAVEKLNLRWTKVRATIHDQAGAFESAVGASYKIFGGSPFRKWESGAYENRFNRALFDIVVYYFADPKVRGLALKRATAVADALKDLCLADVAFLRSIESTTKSKQATATRFNKWASALSNVLKIRIKPPNIQ